MTAVCDIRLKHKTATNTRNPSQLSCNTVILGVSLLFAPPTNLSPQLFSSAKLFKYFSTPECSLLICNPLSLFFIPKTVLSSNLFFMSSQQTFVEYTNENLCIYHVKYVTLRKIANFMSSKKKKLYV